MGYQNASGPYHECGPLFESTLKYMKKIGFEHCKTAGIFYDNPKENNNPRYAVGFIIDKKEDGEKFLKEKDEILKEQWKLLDVKETKTVSSHFPIRFQVLSCMLSAMKTYSAFESQDKYKVAAGCLEIYSSDDVGTYFPQENLTQFLPQSS